MGVWRVAGGSSSSPAGQPDPRWSSGQRWASRDGSRRPPPVQRGGRRWIRATRVGDARAPRAQRAPGRSTVASARAGPVRMLQRQVLSAESALSSSAASFWASVPMNSTGTMRAAIRVAARSDRPWPGRPPGPGGGRVVRDVQPGAEADLDHLARQPGGDPGPDLADVGAAHPEVEDARQHLIPVDTHPASLAPGCGSGGSAVFVAEKAAGPHRRSRGPAVRAAAVAGLPCAPAAVAGMMRG